MPGWKYSEMIRAFSLPLNWAIAPGTTITDDAKMIGMTPAALTRSGMKFFAASRCLPRDMVRCGIWIITRRAAIVTAIVPATTATITMPSTTSEKGPTACVFTKPKVPKIPGQNRSTIEKKMISDAPLPKPRSVICSPSHMTNIAPVVRTSTICSLNPNPGFTTAFSSEAVNSANPQPCTTARTTVT